MKNILIVTGSVRQGNVNQKVVSLVEEEVRRREGLTAQVADLGELGLPFYDAPTPPSAEEYVIPHESVQRWSDMVSQADAVVLVAPEYNHSLSAIQKNAIDWLYKEWTDKLVAFVLYGWYAGANTLTQLQEIGTVVKWKPIGKVVALQFTRDIAVDGSLITPETVQAEIAAAVDQLA